MTELLRDKIELQEKATKWKTRARALQRERVGFVERWRQQNRAAGEAGIRLAAAGSALGVAQGPGGALVEHASNASGAAIGTIKEVPSNTARVEAVWPHPPEPRVWWVLGTLRRRQGLAAIGC